MRLLLSVAAVFHSKTLLQLLFPCPVPGQSAGFGCQQQRALNFPQGSKSAAGCGSDQVFWVINGAASSSPPLFQLGTATKPSKKKPKTNNSWDFWPLSYANLGNKSVRGRRVTSCVPGSSGQAEKIPRMSVWQFPLGRSCSRTSA